MKKHNDYGQENLEVDVEYDYDGTPIKRPTQIVTAVDAEYGYGEAPTSDKDLMKARIEKAVEKAKQQAAPKAKKASKKKS